MAVQIRSETEITDSRERTVTPEPTASIEAEPVRRQRQAIRQLLERITERALVEPVIDEDFDTRNRKAEQEYDATYQEVIVRFAAEKEALEREIAEAHQRIESTYEAERAALETEFTAKRKRFLLEYDDSKQSAKTEFQESRWAVAAVHEGARASAENEYREMQMILESALARMQTIEQETRHYLEECRLESAHDPEVAPPASEQKSADLLRLVLDDATLAEVKLKELRALIIPGLFRRGWLLGMIGLVGVLAIVGLLSLAGIPVIYAFVAGSAMGIILGVGAWFWLHAEANKQVGQLSGPLFKALAEGQSLSRRCRVQAAVTQRKRLKEAKKRFKSDTQRAFEHYRQLRSEQKERRVRTATALNQDFKSRRLQNKERRSHDWQEIVSSYRGRRTDVQTRFDTDSRRAEGRRARALEESAQTHEQEWRWTATAWRDGLAQFAAEAAALNQTDRERFPGWESTSWARWLPPTHLPPVVRFGCIQVDLAKIQDGLPGHARLRSELPTSFALPATLSFPQDFSLLIRAADEGRVRADQILQTIMFRLLTCIPPGKVRFTIIDPIGLGQNFASFMHLADYDEALVSSRIWTESSRIERQLADLTEHMETVIQKYLRNQFETIDEYNAHAGEVAEPYRVLVVANFPMNFTSEASRRLLSIIHSGPRCGVYTLISVDTKQQTLPGFDPKDLQRGGVQLVWDKDRVVWLDPDFTSYPLVPDSPPPEELSTRILRQIGTRAKEAKRVEVPFEFVAPPPEEWWTADSRRGINVPLGRVGATKRQYLNLGQGTAQHVLIAGKTGSGKSSLLHALVNNLALLYSPEELELYLVDFKKGVEFKTYATHELPHARVVAIESEREFGLSVLQRLDAELRDRADKFRAAGAQDLPAFRQLKRADVMPRILLVVDEFQEFFVEDDKIAQEAALLLDRLVRQGRAFGLHVLLGSQTLGGAYSLARSTIDQMAVRIALQCSEADAHLILSEDNAAARLLSRPGEAIYNDANGLVEGNNPFQIVWLSDEKREDYLGRIQELGGARGQKRRFGQIVFEGSAPADVHKNQLLRDLLQGYQGVPSDKPPQAWLGEAIAIKDPTAAIFRRYAASNLLVVGQFDEPALAMMTTALVGLAAQAGAGGSQPRFYVLDGTPDDSPQSGYLGRIANGLPSPVRLGAWRESASLIAELAQEVDRRLAAGHQDYPSMFLIIHGLQRCRDLRRSEDDFSFSARPDEAASPAKQFATILREGPPVGIHALVWCDSQNNLTRFVDRQALREFDLRVLFQMSANDSSNLIDSPLASKLGMYRAYFQSEEQGRLEKFRPYGLPDERWLEWVREQFKKTAPDPTS
jgi:hypothetical protein